ncbi:MAG: SAM hydroxide adenosyltransferase [PVC group bacterium]
MLLTAGKKRYSLPLMAVYSSVNDGARLAVWGSCGFLELAVNGGNAARELGLRIGDRITVEIPASKFCV